MAVTEQLDAMRMCSADPIEVLIVPRLRGAIVASFALVLIGSAVSATAGFLTGILMFSTGSATYWNFELIAFSDVVQGLVKAGAYGVAVPIVSGAFGLRARGGARGVGQATTDAVVGSSLAVVMLDSLISFVSHAMVGQ
jgi:phospholipid/cholesterol/gamma-HCH transport system permease protein